MNIDLKKIKYKNLAHFRFKKLGGKFLLTNDYGEYVFLREQEFKDFIEGKLKKNEEPYLALAGKNFVKNKIDQDKAAQRYTNKKRYLFNGPSFHFFMLTLGCNNSCVYCFASAQNSGKKGLDMSAETARKALQIVFSSPSKNLDINLQGGEALLNWQTLQFIIEEAERLNKKFKKKLKFSIMSNLNLMDQGKFDYLAKKGVVIGTSLDGPAHIHNKNRPSSGGDNYKKVAHWLEQVKKMRKIGGKKAQKLPTIGAIATVSRYSLDYPEAIVDEYVKFGLNEIFLHSLYQLGNSQKAWQKIGYKIEEYIDFYKKALDHIIALNQQGIFFREKIALTFLGKIIGESDPNFLELRSPCGAGTGTLAYSFNGDIYTCGIGKSLSEMGDENFKLGTVDNKYRELIDNSRLKTVCQASCLEGAPGCNECAYQPYCGVCPVQNYAEQKNIFGQPPTSNGCKFNKAILDYLFEKLQDDKTKGIFEKWLNKK